MRVMFIKEINTSKENLSSPFFAANIQESIYTVDHIMKSLISGDFVYLIKYDNFGGKSHTQWITASQFREFLRLNLMKIITKENTND